MKYFCPICGFKGLQSNPKGFKREFLGSMEICPCCGTEFGHDISYGMPGGVEKRICELRANWINRGCPWFDEKAVSAGLEYITKKPVDWNLEKQLANIGVSISKEKKSKINIKTGK